MLEQRTLAYFIRGKYHSTANLLFDWFGLNQKSKSVVNSIQAKQQNPNKIKQVSQPACSYKVVFG